MAEQEREREREPAVVGCAKCAPPEIRIWSLADEKETTPDGGLKHYISSAFLEDYSNHVLLIFADANTIRNCPPCKAALSTNFDIPDVWWTDYNRRANGYFGSQDVLGDDGEVQGLVTWSQFLTKQVPDDREYFWTKLNIFTQYRPALNRHVVLSFPQRKKPPINIPEKVHKELFTGLRARDLVDPFWPYVRLVSVVLGLNDESIWHIRDHVRKIEKDYAAHRGSSSSDGGPGRPNYRRLHDLARHAIHIAEVVLVTCETLQRIAARQRAWMDMHLPASPLSPFASKVDKTRRVISGNVQEQLACYAHTMANFRHRTLSTKDRLTNEINLSFHTVALADSANNIVIGTQTAKMTEQSAELTRQSQLDSATMKKIAFLTAAFLPATFVSAIFSTTFFNFNPDGDKWVMSGKFWVYWAVTIPITIVMPIIWHYWGKRENQNRPSEEFSLEMPKYGRHV